MAAPTLKHEVSGQSDYESANVGERNEQAGSSNGGITVAFVQPPKVKQYGRRSWCHKKSDPCSRRLCHSLVLAAASLVRRLISLLPSVIDEARQYGNKWALQQASAFAIVVELIVVGTTLDRSRHVTREQWVPRLRNVHNDLSAIARG
jgi:hypothetical protein